MIPSATVTSADWNFAAGGSEGLLARLAGMPQTLEQVTERIFQGLKTSADKIYIVRRAGAERGATGPDFLSGKKAQFLLEPDLSASACQGRATAAPIGLSGPTARYFSPDETGADGAVKLGSPRLR